MTTFENIKSSWTNQNDSKTPTDGAIKVKTKVKNLKLNQLYTTVILSITVVVLVAFFFYISAYKVSVVMLGLFLMIASLTVRVVLELYSSKSLKSLNVTLSTLAFKQKLTKHYKNRIRIHYVATPIILALYIVGFVILLPSFKENLSEGFYTYIIISGIVFFMVIVFLIIKTIKKEIQDLKNLITKN